jgi:putative MATE family efflux protein
MAAKIDKTDLTHGGVGATLTRLTIPMIGGMLGMVAFNLADTYFVALLDEGLPASNNLAAMGFIYPVVMFFFMIAMGIGIGTSSVVSRAYGRRDRYEVRRLTTDSIRLAFCVVLLFSLLGLWFMDAPFRWQGAHEDLLPRIRQFMTVWYAGLAFVVLPMVANNAMRGAGDTAWPAVIMLVAAAVNVVLDPIFIFGWWGFPALGLAGAALATVVSRSLTLVASLAVLHWRKQMIALGRFHLRELMDSWKQVLYVGIPSSATNILFPLAFGVINYLARQTGHTEQASKAAVAAIAAGQRIESFAMMVLWSLAGTLLAFMGQNWSAKRFARVHRAEYGAMLFSIGWGLFCWGVLAACSGPIAEAFTDKPLVARKLQLFLWIAPAGYGLRGVCFLASRSFSAINRPIDASMLDILRMFLMYIPLAWIGAWLAGLTGIFMGVAAGNLIAGVVSWARFHQVRRRLEHRIQITDAEPVAVTAE